MGANPTFEPNLGKIVDILNKSKLGRTRYDTGWDLNPHSIRDSVNLIEAETENEKQRILSRAIGVQAMAKEKMMRARILEEQIAAEAQEYEFHSRRYVKTPSPKAGYYVAQRLSGKKRKSFGIHDEDEQTDVALNQGDVISPRELRASAEGESVTRYKKAYHSKILDFQNADREAEELSKEVHSQCQQNLSEKLKQAKDAYEAKCQEILKLRETEKLALQKRAETYELERKKQIQIALDAKLASEKKAEEKRQLEESQRKLVEQKIAQEEQERVRKAEEAKKKAEKELLDRKLAEELKQQNSQKVIPELEGLILKPDVAKESKFANLIARYEEAALALTNASKGTREKQYSFHAMKAINVPLNALTGVSADTVESKILHFIRLLSGEIVNIDSNNTRFNPNEFPSAKPFLWNTLAFRFVKKSESEIVKGNNSVESLATLGVVLCKKFPEWAQLVEAHFYRLCPFLIPYSFPKNDLSNEDYAKALGHDIQASGGEGSINQVLIERVTGYCTLYGLMIKQIHNGGEAKRIPDMPFYSLGGVWEILSKTMKLTPQIDMTATVIQCLLDILGPQLGATYGRQFFKLMQVLIAEYLQKIDAVTPPKHSGAVKRLQLFIQDRFLTRR